MKKKIIVTNLSQVVNRTIVEDLGIVSGAIAPSKFILKDIMAGIRNLLGREMKEYTEMMNEGRDKAIERMVEQAKTLNADAVVNVRIGGSSASQGSSELLAYGTAVNLE
jgi:uncharacterized protein YbjQ (UPF0145 family)